MLSFIRHLRCISLATILVFSAGLACGQDRLASADANPLSDTELNQLASRLLQKASKAKCHVGRCALLVTDFITPSGSTSRLGVQLANSISASLLARGSGIRIVDRSLLRAYLDRERIPSKFLVGHDAAFWLAGELQANAVLTGRIEPLGDRYNLLLEFLVRSKDKIGEQEAVQFSLQNSDSALAPFEPYEVALNSEQTSTEVHKPFSRGDIPECVYCPPPNYTDAARSAKFVGGVVLRVRVTEEGKAAEINVVKGSPFGLNQSAIDTVREWTFKPAMRDGKLVSTFVPIEMTYRLY